MLDKLHELTNGKLESDTTTKSAEDALTTVFGRPKNTRYYFLSLLYVASYTFTLSSQFYLVLLIKASIVWL